eukprot:5895797-Prymnesium_polylepis.1
MPKTPKMSLWVHRPWRTDGRLLRSSNLYFEKVHAQRGSSVITGRSDFSCPLRIGRPEMGSACREMPPPIFPPLQPLH